MRKSFGNKIIDKTFGQVEKFIKNLTKGIESLEQDNVDLIVEEKSIQSAIKENGAKIKKAESMRSKLEELIK